MDFDHKIGRLEQQLGQDDALLRTYAEQFQSEATTFLRQWWWDTATRLVRRNPEQTQKLGSEGIAALKARVNTLRSQTKDIVETYVSGSRVWWHEKPPAKRRLSDRYLLRSERVGPKKLDAALRVAMGSIAPILREFGYIDPERDAQWLEWDEAGERHPPGARPAYPYTFDWPPDLIAEARLYSDRLQQAANRLRDIRILRRRKAEREAESLWNG